MAEGLLRHRAGRFFEVLSAGVSPRPVAPMSVKVMAEIGIDISKQASKGLVAIKDSGSILFLIIVCAAAEEECPATFAPAGIRVFWPLDDPTVARGEANRLKKFREVRDQIREHIEKWLRSDVPADWLR
jgi:arsenate reductase